MFENETSMLTKYIEYTTSLKTCEEAFAKQNLFNKLRMYRFFSRQFK